MKFRIYFFIILLLCCCKKNIKNQTENNIKIVSLAPSITKNLFRLGLQNYLIGVTDFCEYYGEVERLVKEGKIKRISAFNVINYENIISLDPDYILGTDSISYENKSQIEKIFNDKKIYWFMHPRNFEEIKADILRLGNIFHKKEEAKKLVNQIDKELNEIQNKIKDKKEKPKVIVEIFYPPFITAGKDTFISDIIIKAGARLAISLKENWPSVSLEDIIVADPDLVVKTHLTGINEELKILRCYKENNVFIPEDIDIFLQPCYDSIFGVRKLYEYIYEK